MKFFAAATEIELDPNSDSEVRDAQQRLVATMAAKTAAEAAERTAWAAEHLQGTNPPPDAMFWPLRAAANEARRIHQEAQRAYTQALGEATARLQMELNARILENWCDFERETLAGVRQHAEALERLQLDAQNGLRFPEMVALSGPSVMTSAGWKNGRP